LTLLVFPSCDRGRYAAGDEPVGPRDALEPRRRRREPFRDGTPPFARGFTFGGHRVAAAVALANIDLMEREELCAAVRYRIAWR
jgi:hypothetical protein